MAETQLASMRLGSVDTEEEALKRTKSGNNIFIIDGQDDTYLDHIHRSNVMENEHEQSLENTLDLFELTALGDKRYAEHLGERNGLIVPGENGELLEFRIFESHKYRDTTGALLVDVYSQATYLDLKTARIIDPHTTDPETAQQHANLALQNTEWQVGNIDYAGIRTLTFDNYTNPYAYLKRIAREFELELRFYVTTDGQRITGRYVDLIDRIGEWRGRTVEFGRDLQGIRRIERTDEVVTALRGIGPEREDGSRLEVFVEDEEALQRWGRKGRHIVDVYEPQSERTEMTLAELEQYTRTELNKRINAIVSYEVDVVDLENVPGMEDKKIRFGDTIRIKDLKFSPPLYLEARIYNQKRDVFTKANKRVELGDYIEYSEEDVQAIFRQLRQQIQNKISQAQLEDYAEPKKVESDTPPTIEQGVNPIWIDTSKDPHIPHIVEQGQWVKVSPTEAEEIGAETPQGAQDKADNAEQNSKDYTDGIKDDLEQDIQNAMDTADGKNTVFRQENEPSTTDRKTGDLWFKTDEGNKMFVWDGSNWSETKLDHQALTVGQLSAISADLGNVTAGHISGVTLNLANGKLIIDENGNAIFKGDVEGGSIKSNTTIDVTTDLNIGDNITIGSVGSDQTKEINFNLQTGKDSKIRGITDENGFTYLDLINDNIIRLLNATSIYTNVYHFNVPSGFDFITHNGPSGHLRVNDNVIDTIVEQGSIANGNYIRYANGIQIITMRRSASTNASGGLSLTPTFPAAFINTDYVILPIVESSAYINYGLTASKTPSNVTLRGTGLGASSTYNVSIMAIGEWKL